MNADLAIVLALLVAAVVMFGIGRPRSDVVALLMVAALPMTGVIDTADALAGFADPNIVMIALLFVVGEALVRTGIARRAGDWLVDRAGTSETRVLPLLMAIVTTVGSMMSSTGVVALFIPVVTRIARATGIAASRLFMPLSIAALVSGMMTLVATAPNLIVHAELVRSGHEGFGFFSFTPFGVPVLLLAIAYVLVARRWLASAPRDPIAAGLPTEPEDAPPASSRAVPALATLGLMVVLMATGIVPNAQAALIACLLLGLFGCIDMPSAYRSIHWQTLVLIIGMLPFALALERTGGIDLAARLLIGITGDASPRIALGALFATTALLGLFISNTATAVLMAPVAVAIASNLGVSPYPFAMTVALAASAAFMTPVSSPVNALVVVPGGYSFMDFVRIGVPLAVLTGLTCVVLVPWILPL